MSKNGNPAENLVTLKDYIDMRFHGLERATAIADEQMDRRLATMNEIRSALSDQATKFVTCSEMEAEMKVIRAELRILNDFRVSLEAKASQQSVILSLLLSLVGVALGVASYLK
jgi:GAF domain-containing protein